MTAETHTQTVLEPARYARCSVCGEAYFPVHALTPCGHDGVPTVYPFTESGEVYAWTRSYGADGSVLIAMTDFLDGDLRVTAPVKEAESVEIGDRLVVLTSDGSDFMLAPER